MKRILLFVILLTVIIPVHAVRKAMPATIKALKKIVEYQNFQIDRCEKNIFILSAMIQQLNTKRIVADAAITGFCQQVDNLQDEIHRLKNQDSFVHSNVMISSSIKNSRLREEIKLAQCRELLMKQFKIDGM